MPSLETSTPTLSQARDFLATHATSSDANKAAALISVPLFTRLDGKGPNYPVFGSDQEPDFERVVENKNLHASALAVVAVGRSGLVTVELLLTPFSSIKQNIKRIPVEHPVGYFGRPVGGRSDFGVPIKDRKSDDRFTGFVANIGFSEELVGIKPDGKPEAIGGTSLGRADADRMARPALVFGTKYGTTVPVHQIVEHSLDPVLQS